MQTILKSLEEMKAYNMTQFETLKQKADEHDKKFFNLENAQRSLENAQRSLENTQRRQEMAIGKIAGSSNSHRPGTLPSQPEQVKIVTTLRNGKQIGKNTEPIVVNNNDNASEVKQQQEEAEKDNATTTSRRCHPCIRVDNHMCHQ